MRRKTGLGLIFGAVIPLAAVSTAWACGVLATLKLDTRTAKPSQVLSATGNNYFGTAPVSIHLDSRRGPVVATISPDSASSISTSLTIPANTRPGYHLLVATEYKPDGTPIVGTPGRTTVRVLASGQAARRAVVPVSAWGPSSPNGPAGATVSTARAGGSSSPAALPVLLALALSLALLASGTSVAGRRNRGAGRRDRTRTAPQLGV